MPDHDDLNLSEPLRGTTALTRLVRYVLDTNPTNETDWLEWKTALDLSTAKYRFEVAKHVLGFANRHPDRAAINSGGCAYIVLGAEPESLTGQVVPDPAELVSGLRGYIGDRVAWSPITVGVDGASVLVITVEPPSWGDPIHTLQRAFDKFEDGAIFIRRPGSSQRAERGGEPHASDASVETPS